MSLIDPTREIIIQSIAFPAEDTIEITYLEKREQTESVGLVRTIFVDCRRAKCRDDYADLIDLAEDIVDAGLLSMRSPDQELDPRKRFRKRERERERATEDDEDEDDQD